MMFWPSFGSGGSPDKTGDKTGKYDQKGRGQGYQRGPHAPPPSSIHDVLPLYCYPPSSLGQYQAEKGFDSTNYRYSTLQVSVLSFRVPPLFTRVKLLATKKKVRVVRTSNNQSPRCSL
mmetsp:Transcript_1300/g.3042  ORF Transcript_1300/g.3042 Transcript_1300/m.3042 type:complete len:118 (-) Transcript_1300:177-530(-)